MEDDKDERIISLASHGEKKKRTSGNRWEVGTTAKAPRGRKALDIAAGSLFKRI